MAVSKVHRAALVGLTILLLVALMPTNPYVFYQLLRWIAFGVLGWTAYTCSVRNKSGWLWVFAVLTLLYNPIFRTALGRDGWEVANVLTVLLVARFVYETWSPSNSESD